MTKKALSRHSSYAVPSSLAHDASQRAQYWLCGPSHSGYLAAMPSQMDRSGARLESVGGYEDGQRGSRLDGVAGMVGDIV